MKHTPEPWRVEVVTTRGLPGAYITADLAGGGDIADLYILSEMDECIPKECAEANAARIVACVNEFAGVDEPTGHLARKDADLREALDALEAASIEIKRLWEITADGPSNLAIERAEQRKAILRKHGRAV